MKAPTVPFIARYRKEATQDWTTLKLRNLEQRLGYFGANLEARRKVYFKIDWWTRLIEEGFESKN